MAGVYGGDWVSFGVRSGLIDGPIQRQILLLKLLDLMEKRPDFGASFDNNPDGKVRAWIAKVKAVLTRVGIEKSASFNAAVSTGVTYWPSAMKSAQVIVFEAIEELKLELELYHNDNVGKVFEAGKEYDFIRTIVEIVSSAKEEVLIVDPYFNVSIFTTLFQDEISVNIKILMGKGRSEVEGIATRYARQTRKTCEVRSSDKLHDRIILIDDSDCFLIGASIKDGGKKPTYIIPLIPDQSSKKKEIYADIWFSAVS